MKVEIFDSERKDLRAKVNEGNYKDWSFTVSILVDGSGVLVEFENDSYVVKMEEIVKEVLLFKGELDERNKTNDK
jgi:hypothetical protein